MTVDRDRPPHSDEPGRAAETTIPTGRCFISYRRSRHDEVGLLVAALHDHGIPTWQDLNDLGEEPLESALRGTLADPGTASGILWITPDVTHSTVITGIEIPGMTARAARSDEFYLIPVAAGGLDYSGAASAALTPTTLDDFGTWNIIRASHDPITEADADIIARRALARRLAAVYHASPAEMPLAVDIFTRGPVTHRVEAALTVDFTHRFAGRRAAPSSWHDHILPSLNAIFGETARRATDRPVQFRGLIGLPTAVALGVAALAPGAMSATWMQHTPGHAPAAYSLGEGRRPSGFRVALRDHHSDAADLAVLVNISENTVPALRATAGLPEFRGWVLADPPGPHPYLFPGASEAVDLAYEVISTMRSARSRYGRVGNVHLFIAGPVGFAFLLGQLLNTFGTVQTYEHVSDHGVGHYIPAVALRPAD